MKVSPEQFFRNSFFISIDEENAKLFNQVFTRSFSILRKDKSILPRCFRGWKNKELSSVYKCMLSHISIVKIAKSLDIPFVAIFEDDAYPSDDIEEKLQTHLQNIPNDSNMFILGYNKIDTTEKVDEFTTRITGYSWGSHAYIVFKRCYDQYLKQYDKDNELPADWMFQSIQKTYSVNENLFIQYNKSQSMHGFSGYTVNQSCTKDPPPGFPKIENLLGSEE